MGRQSQRFVGELGEVVVNPITGKIISVNPPSSSKTARILPQQGKQFMRIKINKSSLDHLLQKLVEDCPKLARALNEAVKDYKVSFEINEDEAAEIRDWIEEEIQRAGYDKNYELNKEGETLQKLSDKFYS